MLSFQFANCNRLAKSSGMRILPSFSMRLLPQLPFSSLEGMSPPVGCYIAMENCPMIADLWWFTYWEGCAFCPSCPCFFKLSSHLVAIYSHYSQFYLCTKLRKNIRVRRQNVQPSKVDLACHWLMLLPWFLATNSVWYHLISSPIRGQPIMSVISSWSFHVCCSWVRTNSPISSSYWLVNGYPGSLFWMFRIPNSPGRLRTPHILPINHRFINYIPISLIVKPPINSMS